MIDTPPRWRRAFGMLAAPRLLTALRSRPACATPTAVYATATAPEAANDSAIAASARRSSAEGSVADAALSAACAEAAQQSLEALCHWALLSFPLVACSGKQRTREQTSLGQFATLLTAPGKAARRSSAESAARATSCTCALIPLDFSTKNIHLFAGIVI